MRWSRLFAFVMVLAMLLSVASAESMLPRRTETKPQLPEQINQPDSEAEPKAPEAEPGALEAEPGALELELPEAEPPHNSFSGEGQLTIQTSQESTVISFGVDLTQARCLLWAKNEVGDAYRVEILRTAGGADVRVLEGEGVDSSQLFFGKIEYDAAAGEVMLCDGDSGEELWRVDVTGLRAGLRSELIRAFAPVLCKLERARTETVRISMREVAMPILLALARDEAKSAQEGEQVLGLLEDLLGLSQMNGVFECRISKEGVLQGTYTDDWLGYGSVIEFTLSEQGLTLKRLREDYGDSMDELFVLDVGINLDLPLLYVRADDYDHGTFFYLNIEPDAQARSLYAEAMFNDSFTRRNSYATFYARNNSDLAAGTVDFQMQLDLTQPYDQYCSYVLTFSGS